MLSSFKLTKLHVVILLLLVVIVKKEEVLDLLESTSRKLSGFFDKDFVEYQQAWSDFSNDLQNKFINETQNIWEKLSNSSKSIEEAFANGSISLKTALEMPWLDFNGLFGGKNDSLFSFVVTDPDAHSELEDIFTLKSYPYEVHYLTTSDGYILQLFRVQAKAQQGINILKKPVLLNHGIFCGGDVWICNIEELSPVFILANAGYDVWIGNFRGNKYGRNHTWLNPDKDQEFWDFTWQHSSLYDIPNTLSYIYHLTRQKISLIGHSAGALSIIGMLAGEPREDVKPLLGKVFLVGPVTFMKHCDHQILKAVLSLDFDWYIEKFGVQEVVIPRRVLGPAIVYFCHFFHELCGSFSRYLSDTDPNLVNPVRMSVFAGRYPQGTSIRSMIHFQQMLKEQDYIIRLYDYGPKMNAERYGTEQAPVLNLSDIDTHIYIYAGLQDKLTNIEDVRAAAKQLKSVTLQEIDAGHLSFLLGKNMTYVHDIIDKMEDNEESCNVVN